MSIASPLTRLSEAEYFEIERRAEVKSEFFDGEMFAMAGRTRFHSLIAANLTREVGLQLKGRPCLAFTSDLRVKVEATGLFTYPDLSVVCGPQQWIEDDTLLNPTVLIEVLSESTEAYDRGIKFAHYRQIPSLREYVLVSQYEPRIEAFSREPNGQWLLSEASGLGSTIELPSIQTVLSLAEVFAGVAFSRGEAGKSKRPPR
jgi:Uma2 family endonuclease